MPQSGAAKAAGAVVPEGMRIPPGSMVMGIPAKIKREVTADEQQRFRDNARHYVDAAEIYRQEPA